jgi:hypothetical protein
VGSCHCVVPEDSGDNWVVGTIQKEHILYREPLVCSYSESLDVKLALSANSSLEPQSTRIELQANSVSISPRTLPSNNPANVYKKTPTTPLILHPFLPPNCYETLRTLPAFSSGFTVADPEKLPASGYSQAQQPKHEPVPEEPHLFP